MEIFWRHEFTYLETMSHEGFMFCEYLVSPPIDFMSCAWLENTSFMVIMIQIQNASEILILWESSNG